MFDERFERGKRVVRTDFLAKLGSQPLVQKKGAPADKLATDADLFLPEGVFERPMLFVGFFTVRAFGFQSLKHKVSDEIGSG